jgi:hypothetical protein
MGLGKSLVRGPSRLPLPAASITADLMQDKELPIIIPALTEQKLQQFFLGADQTVQLLSSFLHYPLLLLSGHDPNLNVVPIDLPIKSRHCQ